MIEILDLINGFVSSVSNQIHLFVITGSLCVSFFFALNC